ncbi:efflux RND transporter periplasmic adaptor subunit [Nocardioides marmoriginsengisoli]|nr:efflux RND transporter periplasmic adaptor subunit [Nocardioides marmoriginsengisoli]
MPSLPSLPGRRWLVLGLVVVLAGVGGWIKFGPESDAKTQSITATVARGTYKSTVSATGTITPKREADLSFSSSGVVTRVAVSVGDKVTKGDVLAKIDATSLIAQRDAAEAQVTAAEAQLAEDAGGSATQLSADRASLASAESQLAAAQDAVDEATLTAPFSGTVSAVGVEVGDQAGSGGNTPAADGDSTTSAVTVISPRTLLVEANVSASDVSQVKKGMQVEITPTGGGEVVYGTVSDVGVIAGASETGAAQFPVTVEVTGKPAGLYPGSTASLAITIKQATDVLAVPTQALHTDAKGTFVYVMDGKKRTRKDVTIGTAYGMQTEVLKGLAEGDVVELISFTRPSGSGNTRNGGGELPGGEVRFSGGGAGPSGPVFEVGK